MYRLSKTLYGHQSDVKDLAVVNGVIVSCSRDGTIKLWDSKSGTPLNIFYSSTNSFINCVTKLDDDLIASGGKDNVIFINSINEFDKDMGIYNLVGHQNNICSLFHHKNLLISSSWDLTARVWDLDTKESIYTLKHPASVLDALIIDESTYLTCCADRIIRLWKKNVVIKTFPGHTDVVRKLTLLDNSTFASTSNDSTIKIWDLEKGLSQTLEGHNSFVYDVIQLPNGDLVSAGEDRSVNVWKSGKLAQSIILPAISNWTLEQVGDDIVVGSSDNTIRIFTTEPSKFADPEELKQFEDAVSNSTIPEQAVDLNKTDIPGIERLEQPGKEGEVIMVKNSANIEAYQYSSSQWTKIGDVTGASNGNKQTYNGKEYDYVFDVDIEDGKPPLKLPYNLKDNVYDVATKFLADNELSANYVQEIVNFIDKNTEGKVIQESQTQPSPPPEQTPKQGSGILPVTTIIKFEDEGQIGKGLTKYGVSNVPASFKLSSKESADYINTVVADIFAKKQYVLGFDLLRLLVLNLNMADTLTTDLPLKINEFIQQGSESSNPTELMVLLKLLNNLVDSILFVQLFSDQDQNKMSFNEHLEILVSVLLTKEIGDHKHAGQFKVNLATFLYNLSVLTITKKYEAGFLSLLDVDAITDTNESAYRLLICWGNLKLPVPLWGHRDEPRFKDLLAEF